MSELKLNQAAKDLVLYLYAQFPSTVGHIPIKEHLAKVQAEAEAAAEAELALLRGDPAAVAERAEAVVNYVRYGCMAGAAAHNREAAERFVASALQPPPKTQFASVDELVDATMPEGVRKHYHELVAAADAAAVADTQRLDWLEGRKADVKLVHRNGRCFWIDTEVPSQSAGCANLREAIDLAMRGCDAADPDPVAVPLSEYDPDIFAQPPAAVTAPATEPPACDEDEEIIRQCIGVIRTEMKASVVLLQRRLKLGYTRAARIIDELERRELIGPTNGVDPRTLNLVKLAEATA